MSESFHAVWAVSVALLGGAVLQVSDISAGNGLVIDWREVKSGATLMDGGDAFDVAYLFVTIVGADAALCLLNDVPEPPAPPEVAPRVHVYMVQANGGRARSFDAGAFRVIVEAHEEDDAQAAFTERLALAAADLVVR